MYYLSKEKLLSQKRFDHESCDHKNGYSDEIHKNAFFSDLERIVFSSSFRRLQDKAQVYPLDPNDYSRTRLTHSLEVSALSASLGNMLIKALLKMKKNERVHFKKYEDCNNASDDIKNKINIINNEMNKIKQVSDDVCIVLKCSGLLHDIGNPPFGHYGEDVIKKYFYNIFYTEKNRIRRSSRNLDSNQKKIFTTIKNPQIINDLLFFDGNAQTIRVITKLHSFNSKKYGLNLTAGVLGSLFKYPYPSLNTDYKDQKFGYFFSENSFIDDLEKLNESKNDWCVLKLYKRNPLSLLMEAADDIACTISDFEDAVQKGHIRYRDIFDVSSKIDIFTDGFDEKSKDECLKFLNEIIEYYNNNVKSAINEPFRSTISRVVSKKREEFKQSVIKCFIENYDLIMKGEFNSNLIENCDYCKMKEFMSKIIKAFVYPQNEVIIAELQGKNIINYLFYEFLTGVLSTDFDEFITNRRKAKNTNHKICQLISKNYIDQYIDSIKNISKSNYEQILYYKIRMVIDQICSMTDSYAKDSYIRLLGLK